ncbi:hypothetical protein DFQ11_102708 [Winogradskyella epiphytica]|uniref:Uncharacterized protein n=1 Tax=Winogradskyella epiphytica TaxID=262005 RepID=A0A2V4YF53_9FLAO|nr:hypothetical protein [Winogradskyella epiphytica]PYE82127.1 hypothetical protein DFQ11_102708 [Winogradskyella epiphytica]GGW60347.1 hypothetical protein GCM10008085_09690 [Winogradskyella epiphytica]
MDIIKNNIVILMTGTINPNSFATLALKDPDTRRAQYIEAIKFYLEKTSLNIDFTENSGTSIESEFEHDDNKDRLEFLTYKSEPSIPDRGKGAKELEIISYSIFHSKFISKSDAIVKITGRLKILNIIDLNSNFFALTKRYKKVYSCNIYKVTKMDARCFFFTKDFFPYLEQVGRAINLKYSIEMALWDSVFEYLKFNGTYKQLKRPLRIEGVNAGFGTSYEDSFISATAKRVRHFVKAPYYYRKISHKIKLEHKG